MSAAEEQPEQRGEIRASPWSAGCSTAGAALFTLTTLIAVGSGLAIGRCTSKPAPAPAASVVVVRPTPNVITAVRDLARLEGAEFHIERVIDLSQKQKRVFGLVETEDSLLLVAAGDVVAGVDLGEIREKDIQVDPQASKAKITLPPPKILSSRLDNKRTYVHTRSTDLLAKRQESLETRARQEAEQSIVKAAEEGGILDRARKSNRRTVTALVRSLGYQKVEVHFKDEAR